MLYRKLVRCVRGLMGLPKSRKEAMGLLLNAAREEVDLNTVHSLLIRYWERLKIDQLKVPSKRRMLGIPLKLNHPNIDSLLTDLDIINELLAAEDYTELTRFSKNKYSTTVRVSLDGYFTTSKGIPVSIEYTLKQLQDKLLQQQDILSTIGKGSHAWILNSLYYDLITLSETLTKNLMGES